MKAWRRAQHGEDLSEPAEDLDAAISPIVIEEFGTLPIALQQRLINAVDNSVSKVVGLR